MHAVTLRSTLSTSDPDSLCAVRPEETVHSLNHVDEAAFSFQQASMHFFNHTVTVTRIN